jgi:hypothetical protein
MDTDMSLDMRMDMGMDIYRDMGIGCTGIAEI